MMLCAPDMECHLIGRKNTEDTRERADLQWTDSLRNHLRHARGSERQCILQQKARDRLRDVESTVLCAEVLWLERIDVHEGSPLWELIRDMETQAHQTDPVKRS